MVYFDQILHTYTFSLCLDSGMYNGVKAFFEHPSSQSGSVNENAHNS